MSDSNLGTAAVDTNTEMPRAMRAEETTEVVSTHVLVEEDKVEKLRELSRRTRVAQSEYLREAVDDLLTKYKKHGEG